MSVLIEQLKTLNGARFASFTYKSKSTGELAKHTVILGFDYNRCVVDSVNRLSVKLDKMKGLRRVAADELMDSWNNTLIAHAQGKQNDAYTKKGQYTPLFSGLNINSTDNSLQLFGLAHTKTVIEPGVYKKIKSAQKTIFKNKIKKALPIGKFREFALDVGNIKSARLNGETIEFDTV